MLDFYRNTQQTTSRKPDLPPLSQADFDQLRHDSSQVLITAKKKNIEMTICEMREEMRAAKEHFALGCWLFYYSNRIHEPGASGLRDRIDCLRRIFEAGLRHTYYSFHTVFNFGDREFRTIFSCGDKEAVINALRPLAKADPDGSIASAFTFYGWPLSAQPRLFQH